MPIWLRRFTFNEISKFYQEEKESYEKANKSNSSSKTVVNSEGKITNPEFLQNMKTSRKPIKYT